MNIIIIPAFFQTKKNPTLGSFFADQARALQKAGHKVSIIYCDTYSVKCLGEFISYGEDGVSDMEGIKIYRKRMFCPLKHGVEGHRRQFAEGITKLYDEHLSGENIDIIHAHCCVWAGYAAKALSDKVHVPYIVTEHATLFGLHRDRISRANNACIKEVFGRAAGVICVSRALAGLLSEYRADIDVVGNVVNCGRFVAADGAKRDKTVRFLTVCHMADEEMLGKKGIDILLESWKMLTEKSHDVHLTIGGGGRGRQKAVQLCKEYGIEDKVTFIGQLGRDEVAAQMQECDVFVLPSRYETFGVVYIEAMACGKPVIAVRNGGPDDFVKDFNGILIPPEDCGALTQAMADMIERREKYDGRRIADFVKECFSERVVADRLTQIYDQVLGRVGD